MKPNTQRARLLSIALALATLVFVPRTHALAQEDPQSHRTAAYFQRGYSAYAFAQESTAGEWTFDVYLQFVPGYLSDAETEGYKIVVDGQALSTELAAVQTTSAQDVPSHYTASAEMPDDAGTITLVPQTAAGALEDEAIVLYDAASPSEIPAATAVVQNPVATDKLNLRVAPNSEGDSLRQYYNGVQVDVLAVMPDDWVAVSIGQAGGAARGYMKSDYLAFGEQGAAVVSAIPSYESIVDSWTLYSYPDEASAPVAEYAKGQAFDVLGRSSRWWHIAVDGHTGFVRADVLVTEEVPTPEAPLDTPAPEEATEAPATAQP